MINTLDPAPAGRTVTARLVAPVGWFSTEDGPREVVVSWTTTVATDGTFELNLPVQSSYDAVDTWYKIEYQGAVHAVVVPDTPGPHQVRDIEIDNPAGTPCCPPPTAVTTGLIARVDALEDLIGDAGGDPDLAAVLARLTALETQPQGYRHTQFVPVSSVQMVHDLPFTPAGVLCFDDAGDLVEPDTITHPATGVVEVGFGRSFSGRIDLS